MSTASDRSGPAVRHVGGLATVKDLAGWASLTLAEVRRGLEMVGGELQSVEIDGVRYWFTYDCAVPIEGPSVHLVQGYDEYVMGYFETRGLMSGQWSVAANEPNPFLHIVLLDGVMIWRWKRTEKRAAVAIDVRTYRTLADDERDAVAEAADGIGRYYGLPVALTIR